MPPSRQTGKVSMAFQESSNTPEWYLLPRAAFALTNLAINFVTIAKGNNGSSATGKSAS